MQPYNTDIIFYSSPEDHIRVEVLYGNETFWLPQKRMAELFGVEVPAISKHLKNILESGEFQEDQVISKMETTAGYLKPQYLAIQKNSIKMTNRY